MNHNTLHCIKSQYCNTFESQYIRFYYNTLNSTLLCIPLYYIILSLSILPNTMLHCITAMYYITLRCSVARGLSILPSWCGTQWHSKRRQTPATPLPPPCYITTSLHCYIAATLPCYTTLHLQKNTSETDVASWCDKCLDGLDGSPGGVKERAPYGTNKCKGKQMPSATPHSIAFAN